MKTPKSTFILLILIVPMYAFAQERKRVYSVESAYHALYKKDKRSFEPFKGVKIDKGKWFVELYRDKIVINKGKSVDVFTVLKTELKSASAFTCHVRNPQGNRYMIEYSTHKVDEYLSSKIDIFDLYKDGSFKALTMYVVKKQ